jgi:hypothetical protein
MPDELPDHPAPNPPPDDPDSPERQALERQALRDSFVELIARLPARAAGEYVLDEELFPPRVALRWQDADGREIQNQLVVPDHLLMMHRQEHATWLPERWVLFVFPVGWSLSHLRAWFDWAQEAIWINHVGNAPASEDQIPSYLPTPRRIVAHAHMILRRFNLPNPPVSRWGRWIRPDVPPICNSFTTSSAVTCSRPILTPIWSIWTRSPPSSTSRKAQ